MPKKITTLNMLNTTLRAEYADATLACNAAKLLSRPEDEADGQVLRTKAVLDFINKLRAELGEPAFKMYCEDTDEGVAVFEDIQRQQVVTPAPGK